MKLALKLTILLLAVIAVGVITAPFLINWNSYKPAIETQFSKKTGLELDIGGSVHLHVLPFPGVTISDIVVRNPDIKTSQEILEIGRVELAVNYARLFVGKVVFDQLSVIEPNINIASTQQGEFNWQTDEIKALLAARNEKQNVLDQNKHNHTFVSGIEFKNISFHKAHLTLQKGEAAPFILKDMELEIKSASPLGPYNLTGKGTVQNQIIQFEAKTEKFVPDTQSLSLKADLFLPEYEAKLSYSGVLGADWPLDAQGESSLVLPASTIFDLDTVNNDEKNIRIKSLLTTKSNDLNLKNLQITYGQNVLGKGSAGVTTQKNRPSIFADIELTNEPFLANVIDAFIGQSLNNGDKQTGLSFEVKDYLKEAIHVTDKTSEYMIDIRVDIPEVNGERASIKSLQLNINKSSQDIDSKLDIESVSFAQEGWQLSNIRLASGTSNASLSDRPSLTYNLAWTFDGVGIGEFTKHRLGLKLPTDFINENYNAASISGEAEVNLEKVSIKQLELVSGDKRLEASGHYKWPEEGGQPGLAAKIKGRNLALHQQLFIPEGGTSEKSLKDTVDGFVSNIKSMASALGVDFEMELTNAVLVPQNHVIDKFSVTADLSESTFDIKELYLSEGGQNEFRMNSSLALLEQPPILKFNLNADLQRFDKSIIEQYLKSFYSNSNSSSLKVLLEYSGTLGEGDFSANLNLPKSAVKLNGQISDPLGDNVEGAFKAQVTSYDLSDLFSALRGDAAQDVDLAGKTDLFIELLVSEDLVKASNIEGVLLNTSVKSDLEFKTGGKKPVVDAVVQLGSWDASQIISSLRQKNDKPQMSTEDREGSEDTRNVRWSRNAFNTEWMHLLNGTLTFAAKDVTLDKVKLTEPALEASLKDGRLDIRAFDTKALGGQALFSGKVYSKKDPRAPLSFNANVELKNVSSRQITNAFDDLPDNFISGGITLNGQYSSFGLSPAAMIFGLEGKGTVKGTGITINGIDLDRLARNLATANSGSDALALLDSSLSGGKTVFQTLSGAYTITEGIVNIDKLDLQAQNTAVNGTGEIDLPLWRLDLDTIFSIKKPEDAPPIKANFKGPLDSPKKTFAQSPLKSFINNRLQNELQKILEDKLNLRRRNDSKSVKPAAESEKTPEGKAKASSPSEPASPDKEPSPEEQILRGILGDMLQ